MELLLLLVLLVFIVSLQYFMSAPSEYNSFLNI